MRSWRGCNSWLDRRGWTNLTPSISVYATLPVRQEEAMELTLAKDALARLCSMCLSYVPHEVMQQGRHRDPCQTGRQERR